MEKVQECMECVSIKQEVFNLKKEISGLTIKLDRLLAAVSHDTKEIACQSLISSNTIETQTETDSLSNAASPSEYTIIPNIFESTSLSASYQEDVLLDIFLETESKANQNSSMSQNKTFSTPFIILPFVSVPNSPFADFDFCELEQETHFDTVLGNRSLAYFGEYDYSYNGVNHKPNPIPKSDRYLCSILEHLYNVLPNFEYNSILISKYNDGTDFLGFHSDNESEIVNQSDIVTISLGQTRTAKFRALPGSGNSCPEQSLVLEHGHVFLMSRLSQNYFEHSIIADNSQNPRISLTFRLLKPSSTLRAKPNSSALPVANVLINNDAVDVPLAQSANVSSVPDKITLYIGDSLFRHFSASKLSTSSQKAVVLSYPGATVKGILAKIKTDPAFAGINPQHVSKIYLFCGANNVDKVLNIPFHQNSDFIEGDFQASESAVNSIKAEFHELKDFLHGWANNAIISILNVLPRESLTRNIVINQINKFIYQLSSKNTFVEMISTEKHRSLFSFHDGFRKRDFFSNNGDDNVHLNNLGVVRLAKYLKYFAHH